MHISSPAHFHAQVDLVFDLHHNMPIYPISEFYYNQKIARDDNNKKYKVMRKLSQELTKKLYL